MLLSACDLQPKIVAIPENIGDFISSRYPALLADPESESEIYNSAAMDYGVYESVDMYGTENIEDYTLYSDPNDYSAARQKSIETQSVQTQNDYLKIPEYKINTDYIIVKKGDTLYSVSRQTSIPVKDLISINKLSKPYNLNVGQKLQLKNIPVVINKEKIDKEVPEKKYEFIEITVEKGDTLYSISRKYQLPVNDLAVINKLSAPFALSVGQKIKVPKLNAFKNTEVPKSVTNNINRSVKTGNTKSEVRPKISSDPIKPLPKIVSRSSSKFNWPVRGKILSDFGIKSNGLYNDGINIGAKLGTMVAASENGVVAYAGNELKGMGNLIIVQHAGGWMTVYAHLDTMIVKRGTRVVVGQKLGTVGQTGKVDKPQLHFEIRKGTKSYNPNSNLK